MNDKYFALLFLAIFIVLSACYVELRDKEFSVKIEADCDLDWMED